MERIFVSVRARPLSPDDAKTSPWRISGNSISIANQPTKFEFDRIFGEDSKTVEVYEARTKEIVAAALRGFNGTVFAYGQTNSGKTHTMRGTAAEPGVIPLAVHDLFRIIQEDMDREFLLRMSYMEIYNEEINDLLAPEHRKLQVHESLERGIFVAGLREEIVASPEQVLDFMEFGESHRHIGETNMNVYSSRSHTIFRMIIESRDKSEDGDIGSSCDAVRVSVLNLVDLAGSERAAKTGAEGVRLKEGSHINKSLMTLGTVIKKLSEGAESQGGHVPYRDSKLTRILQPALGGNANTAIICNITFAQIHVDETKCSLQFASRALRVTNCARVNEILTDAALLKRQKKEIEELRAKLQGSNSEHFEEEILNLRNTLLKSELERERITLELQEEKKAQAQRERTLQEQAKKIANLSSMVLYSNRDEKLSHYKKDKRRDTWCPGVLSREALREVSSLDGSKVSIEDPIRPERNMEMPLPFEELVKQKEGNMDDTFQEACKADKNFSNDSFNDCILPDARTLLNVTNRRKAPHKKKSSLVESSELVEMQVEYEDLLLEFETQRTVKDIEIECLTKRLAAAECYSNGICTDSSFCHISRGDRKLSLRESEAILVIKKLQEQIKNLEMDKAAIQKNLDNVVELATEQNISAVEKYDKLYQELVNTRGQTSLVCEEVCGGKEDYGNSSNGMSMEVQEILLEVHKSKSTFDSISLLIDDLFKSFSAASKELQDLRSLMCQNSMYLKSISCDHEKIYSCMRKKIVELENEKYILSNQALDLHKQIEELRLDLQNSEKALSEHCKQQDLEKGELLSQIQILEKEISGLSSCSLAREKENLRKELEKTKTKLKETEFKLKNAIQDKTKLEGEKAYAEREIKHLHGQKILLERDISKRDSLAGRRRESKAFDSNKGRAHNISYEQTLQDEYKKLEVLAFEMETTIASLEEDLAVANGEKEEALVRNEILASELEATSNKLNTSDTELKMLEEEISSMRLRLDECESLSQRMESSIKLLSEEKEELAMQLTDALLELEEEKVIWSAKEKTSIESIAEKAKLSNTEKLLFSKELSEVSKELEASREECKCLRKKLILLEENLEQETKCSMEKSSEIDQLRNDLKIFEIESKRCQDDLKNQIFSMMKERDKLLAQDEQQQALKIEMETLKKNYDDMLFQARVDMEELSKRYSTLETRFQNENANNIMNAKLRMRLRNTQAKLDAFRGRYKESVDEMIFMDKKFHEASEKLKEQLGSYGREVLELKKQLSAVKHQC
ncbi:PREDICTED: kinesin-like protein KIN-7O isoform X2 [Nelumbo nucifera]|uniref:Kinesin motor domain-containing protein n=2 Tax=Nelumbo nucifera TaxID=4432 RepID=A0A822Z8R4_NELNU|nr:PREDICTED: kinesin-like protein KIN-7O isoform X2 [Nelumbo nucifera]DAD42734.1 TPA_asm: hypothetical protein HUJ06_000964 [Nelumbo nucifera]